MDYAVRNKLVIFAYNWNICYPGTFTGYHQLSEHITNFLIWEYSGFTTFYGSMDFLEVRTPLKIWVKRLFGKPIKMSWFFTRSFFGKSWSPWFFDKASLWITQNFRLESFDARVLVIHFRKSVRVLVSQSFEFFDDKYLNINKKLICI